MDTITEIRININAHLEKDLKLKPGFYIAIRNTNGSWDRFFPKKYNLPIEKAEYYFESVRTNLLKINKENKEDEEEKLAILEVKEELDEAINP